MKILFLLFLSILSACTNSAYQGNDSLGVEELILESYQILGEKADINNMYSVKSIDPQKQGTVCAGLRLLEALSLIKISKEANLSKSYLIRNNQLLSINLQSLLEKQDMKQNIVLKRDDKIYIVENSYIMMLGELEKEKAIDVSNGCISLKQALTHTGGILPSGDKAYIQIFRGGVLQPKVYTVHLKHIVQLPEHSMLLIPGDVICVAAKPFTRRSFIINQQLPNFIAFDLLKKRSSLEITIE